MFTVAMETPPNKVKMSFFNNFRHFFPLILKLLIKISVPHHEKTNIKLLL